MTVAPEEVHKYGIMVTDDAGQIIHFQEKPSAEDARSQLA
ncbi:MAG: sugar phosphate nucleotidyltransferase, partial [Pseudomonadota bacterium]